MSKHTIIINKQEYTAIVDGVPNHPQGKARLVGLVRDGRLVWEHRSYRKALRQ